ncbi:MAG: phosphoribosylpyrophosphate synthetase [Elusimicrobia bacterium RIFOXYC2_FULL_34_12]|nr:MAG: phosphoribosylpyrophosphate synthetase [Elusimicrobia bacterium RIFOXYC2_FULL_34_12]OGS38290.1 MAG: phosphoribosylpyrophosphate synthetase [Elusimicrobia bacterium RIFOXYD2_FULL_34_30]
MSNGKLKVFSGTANLKLSKEVSSYLKNPLGNIDVGRFPDGEIKVKINQNVRNSDVFIIQPSSTPANENLMELLIIIDALRRASVQRITAVIPYFGYSRQDRKAEPRVPISAKLVSNLITVAGADRILTLDLHAGQIQGFFDIPVDNLYVRPVLVDYFIKKKLQKVVVVSPDAGGVERARSFAKRIKSGLAIIDKRRLSPEEAEVMHIIGDVKNKNIIIVDDMIDTAGTLVKAAQALKNAGANDIYATAAHGIFARDAYTKIENSVVKEVIVTNSIYHENIGSKKIKVLSIGNLLAEAILRIHKGSSVSNLFE